VTETNQYVIRNGHVT